MASFYEKKAEFYKNHATKVLASRTKALAIVAGRAQHKVAEVEPGLFLGSCDVEQDSEFLRGCGITHILQAAIEVQPSHKGQFVYKCLDLLDIEEQDLVGFFGEAFAFMQDAQQGGAVLVHCVAGVSRSAAIVTGYLMWKCKLSQRAALTAVRMVRPMVNPHLGFRLQLQLFEASGWDWSAWPGWSLDRFLQIKSQLAHSSQLDELSGTLTSAVQAQAPGLLKDLDADSPCCSKPPSGGSMFAPGPSHLSSVGSADASEAVGMDAAAGSSPMSTALLASGDRSSGSASASSWSGSPELDASVGRVNLSSSIVDTGTSVSTNPGHVRPHVQHESLHHTSSSQSVAVLPEPPPYHLSLPPTFGGHDVPSPEPVAAKASNHSRLLFAAAGSGSLSADATPAPTHPAQRNSTPPANPASWISRPLRFLSLRSNAKPSVGDGNDAAEPAALSSTPKVSTVMQPALNSKTTGCELTAASATPELRGLVMPARLATLQQPAALPASLHGSGLAVSARMAGPADPSDAQDALEPVPSLRGPSRMKLDSRDQLAALPVGILCTVDDQQVQAAQVLTHEGHAAVADPLSGQADAEHRFLYRLQSDSLGSVPADSLQSNGDEGQRQLQQLFAVQTRGFVSMDERRGASSSVLAAAAAAAVASSPHGPISADAAALAAAAGNIPGMWQDFLHTQRLVNSAHERMTSPWVGSVHSSAETSPTAVEAHNRRSVALLEQESGNTFCPSTAIVDACNPPSPDAAAPILSSEPTSLPVQAHSSASGPATAAQDSSRMWSVATAVLSPDAPAAWLPMTPGRHTGRQSASGSQSVRIEAGIDESSSSANLTELDEHSQVAGARQTARLGLLPLPGMPAAGGVPPWGRMSTSGTPGAAHPSLSQDRSRMRRSNSTTVLEPTATPRELSSTTASVTSTTPAQIAAPAAGPGPHANSLGTTGVTPSRLSADSRTLSLTDAVVHTLAQTLGVGLTWGQQQPGLISPLAQSGPLARPVRHAVSRRSSQGPMGLQLRQPTAEGRRVSEAQYGGAREDGLEVSSRTSSVTSGGMLHQSHLQNVGLQSGHFNGGTYTVLSSRTSSFTSGLHAVTAGTPYGGSGPLADSLDRSSLDGGALSRGGACGWGTGTGASLSAHASPLVSFPPVSAAMPQLHSTGGLGQGESLLPPQRATTTRVWGSAREARAQSTSGTPLPAIPPTPRESEGGGSAGYARSSGSGALSGVGRFSSRGVSMSGVPDPRLHTDSAEPRLHTGSSGSVHLHPHEWVTPRTSTPGSAAPRSTSLTALSTHYASAGFVPLPDAPPSRMSGSGKASLSGACKPPLAQAPRTSMASPSLLPQPAGVALLSAVYHATGAPAGSSGAAGLAAVTHSATSGPNLKPEQSLQCVGADSAALPTRRTLELGLPTPRTSAPGAVIPSALAPALLLPMGSADQAISVPAEGLSGMDAK